MTTRAGLSAYRTVFTRLKPVHPGGAMTGILAILAGALVLAGGESRGADAFFITGLAAPLTRGIPAPLRVDAWTGGAPETGFAGDVELSLFEEVPAPGLLLSRVVQNQLIELVNAGRDTLSFHGTITVFGDVHRGPLDPSTVLRFDGSAGAYAPQVLAPGDHLLIGGGQTPAGYAGQFVAIPPDSITWFRTTFSAVTVAEDGVSLDAWAGVDFAPGIPFIPALQGGQPAWEGPGSPVIAATPAFWRTGVTRTRSAADWRASARGASNPGSLTLPLSSSPRALRLQPGSVHLSGGTWAGTFTPGDASTHALLRTDDLQGHATESGPLLIKPSPVVEVLLAAGNLITEGSTPVKAAVRISEPATSDLVVQITSSHPGEITGPGQAVIAAGNLQADVNLESLDDGVTDGPVEVTLTPTAAGYESRPTVVTNLDRVPSSLSLQLPAVVLPALNDPTVAAFSGRLLVDRPQTRDVTVRFVTEVLTPGWTPAVKETPTLPSVTIPAGWTSIPVTGWFSSHPLISGVRYRVRARVAGWEDGVTEIEARNALQPSNSLELAPASVGLKEGSGLVPLGFYLTSGLMSTNDTVVTLSSSNPALLSVPDAVVLPRLTTQLIVPVNLGRDGLTRGSVMVTVTASGGGAPQKGLPMSVNDADPNAVVLTPSSGIAADTNVSLSLQLASQVGSLTSANVFSGSAGVTFQAAGQSIRWIGADTVAFQEGKAVLAGKFEGVGRQLALQLTLDGGRVITTPVFDVVRRRSGPLEPCDLQVFLPAEPAPRRVGDTLVVPVTVSNAGPAVAERVSLALGQAVPGTAQLGQIPAGASVQTMMSIPIGAARRWSVPASATADNPDPDPSNNDNLVFRYTATNAPVAGRIEIVHPITDLAYSPSTGRFYLSPADDLPPRIEEIDPETGAFLRSFPLPARPGLLQVSPDGAQLWVLLNGGTNLTRVDLATGTTNLWAKFASPAVDIAAVPTRTTRVVVAHADQAARVYDLGVQQGVETTDVSFVESDPTTGQVVALGSVVRTSVEGTTWIPSGTPLTGGAPLPGIGPDFGMRAFRGGILMAHGEGSVPGITGTVPYAAPGGLDVAVEPTGELVYRMLSDTTLLVQSTNNPTWKRPQIVGGLSGSPRRLTRWGASGIAFHCPASGQVVFLKIPSLAASPVSDLAVSMGLRTPTQPGVRSQVEVRVTNQGPAAVPDTRVVLGFPNRLQVADGSPAPAATGFNQFEFRLGTLAPGESRSVSVTDTNRPEPPFAVSAWVHGAFLDSNPGNNTAAQWIPDNAAESPRSWISVISPMVRLPGGSGVVASAFSNSQLLLLNTTHGGVDAAVQLTTPLLRLFPSGGDGFVYGLANGGKLIHRARLQDGALDQSISLSATQAIADVWSPPGRPEVAVVGWRAADAPAVYGVRAFKDGVPLPWGSPKSADLLVAGATEGEFFGFATDARQPVHRFRVDDLGITWIADAGPSASNLTSVVRVGGFLVDSSGAVRSATNGTLLRQLWSETDPRTLAASPTGSHLLALHGAFPLTPENGLELWDPATGVRALRWEQPLTNTVSGDEARFAPIGTALVKCPADIAAAAATARVSISWLASADDVPANTPLETSLIVENLGTTPLPNVLLRLNLSPFVVDGVTANTGSPLLGSDAQGHPTIGIGDLPPGARVELHPVIRCTRDALVALEAQCVTSTPHAEFRTAVPALVGCTAPALSTRAASIHTGVNAGVTDAVYDPVRDRLWIAMDGQSPQVVALDVSTRKRTAVIPVGFRPERLALSDDAAFLYAAPAFGPIVRLNLATLESDQVLVIAGPSPTAYAARAMGVVPGHPDQLIAGLGEADVQSLALFSAGKVLPARHVATSGPVDGLAALPDGRWVSSVGTNLVWVTPTANGLSVLKTAAAPPSGGTFAAADGRLYFRSGIVTDADTGAVLRFGVLASDAVAVPGPLATTVLTAAPLGGIFTTRPVSAVLSSAEGSSGSVDWSLLSSEPVGTVRGLAMAGEATMAAWVQFVPPSLGALSPFGRLLLAPLRNSDAGARIQLSARWPRPVVPVGTAQNLLVQITNVSPWLASNLVINLPSDFDTQFSGWQWNTGVSTATRNGGQILLPTLGSFAGGTLTLKHRGLADPGEAFPTVSVASVSPASPAPLPEVTTPVRFTAKPLLHVPSITVEEADVDQPVSLVFTLPGNTPVPVTFKIATTNGTALAGSDYTKVNTTTLTIPAGTNQVTATITLTGDKTPEPTESFSILVTSVNGAVADSNTAVITVLDNDLPSILAGDVQIAEGDDGSAWLSYPVRLSFPPLMPARVEYTTRDLTAIAGTDYAAARGTLLFAAGQTESQVRLRIVGDTTAEPDEVFQFLAFGSTGADRGGVTASITLLNDDVSSTLQLGLPQREGATVLIPFQGSAGVSYQLQRSAQPQGPWEDVGPAAPATAAGGTLSDPHPPEATAFYRARQATP